MKQTRSKDSGAEDVESSAEEGKVDVSSDGKDVKEDLTVTIEKEVTSPRDETADGNGKEQEIELEEKPDYIGGRVIGESVDRKLNGVAGREQSLALDEMSGIVDFRPVYNDGTRASMKTLILLKNVFSKQLPNMPKDYIVRLVLDPRHKSMIVSRNRKVVGGITYRPFYEQKMAEIAFCAVMSSEQVKGFGSRLMTHLKQHILSHEKITHLLTFADNNAVGYFSKQGFCKDISLEKEKWSGFIKEYDGGTLMEGVLDSSIPYTHFHEVIKRQREEVDKEVRKHSNSHVEREGLRFIDDMKFPIDWESIPGVKEAGWKPDEAINPKLRMLGSPGAPNEEELLDMMEKIIARIKKHTEVWPFLEPVDAEEVPDYYSIIKDPTDIQTIETKMKSSKYFSLSLFMADLRRMTKNAKRYNSPDTIYFKAANKIEACVEQALSEVLFDIKGQVK